MKKVAKLKILLILLVSVYSCQKDSKSIIYEVTPEFAQSIDKPEVHFVVEIPETLQFDKPVPGKKSSSYGMIQKIGTKDIVTEMYSFGYISLEGINNLEQQGIDFLKQVKSMLRRGGYLLEDSVLGQIEFDGKTYLGLQIPALMEAGKSDLFEGRYLFNVIITPNPKGNTHIMHLMCAKEEEINTYDDFSKNLSISKVWQSFRYK